VPCQSFVQLTKDIKDQEEDYVKSSSILCTHNFNARLILKWSQFKSPLSCDHFFHFNTQPLQFKGASIVAMNANKHIITSIEKSKRYRFPNTTNKPKPGNEFNLSTMSETPIASPLKKILFLEHQILQVVSSQI
jgi:hypothetical protein